jgi:hypothetical protein
VPQTASRWYGPLGVADDRNDFIAVGQPYDNTTFSELYLHQLVLRRPPELAAVTPNTKSRSGGL